MSSATPSAPVSLQATGGNGQVYLSWQAPSSTGGSPITNYKIYRGTSPGAEIYLVSVGKVNGTGNSRLVNINETSGFTPYYSLAVSSYVSTVLYNSFGLPAVAQLTATDDVIARALNISMSELYCMNGTTRIFWGSSYYYPGAYGILFQNGSTWWYDVWGLYYYSSHSIILSNLMRVTNSSTMVETTYTDTSVTNGPTFYYKVSAINNEGEGLLSNEASATPSITVPGTPRNLQAIAATGQVMLEWQASASNGGAAITNYKVYRDVSPDISIKTLLATVGNITTWMDTSVMNEQTYYYHVSAVNSVGEGALSNEVSVTPPLTPTLPSTPQNLQATGKTGRVLLGWQAPASNGGSPIMSYKIYRGTSSGKETLLATKTSRVNGTGTNRTVEIDEHGGFTPYYSLGVSSYVSKILYYQFGLPALAELTASDDIIARTLNISKNDLYCTNGTAIIFWGKSYAYPGAYGILFQNGNTWWYDVWGLYYYPDHATILSNLMRVTSSSASVETTFTDTSVTSGQNYYYIVSTVNGVGEGPKSSETRAIPGLDYLATYSFTNSTGSPSLAGWNPSTQGANVHIIDKVGTNGAGVQAYHGSVLALDGNATAVQAFGSNQTAGSIDFYMLVNDTFLHDINLQQKIGSAWMDCITIRLKNGILQVKSGMAFIDGRYGPHHYSTNTWYEIRVEFNCGSTPINNTANESLAQYHFNTWVNAVLEFANASMSLNPNTIGRLVFVQATGQSYFDAIDYSWNSTSGRSKNINSSTNIVSSDFKVYHDVVVHDGATLHVAGNGTTLYMDGKLVVEPGASLVISNGATINARDGLNWLNYGPFMHVKSGDHFDADCVLGGIVGGMNAHLSMNNGTLACDGMYLGYARCDMINHSALDTIFVWGQCSDNGTPFSANDSTITCSKTFDYPGANGINAIALDHVIFTSPLIYLQGYANITITDCIFNGILDVDVGIRGTITDSKIMAFLPAVLDESCYWQHHVISTRPGATTIGITLPWMNFTVTKATNGSYAQFKVTPATSTQFPGTAFENYSVQWNGNGGWSAYPVANANISMDFTHGSNVTVMCNLPRFDQQKWDGTFDPWNNVHVRDCTAARKLTIAGVWGDMQNSSTWWHTGEWESTTTISATIVNCEFVSVTNFLPAMVANWTGWSIGNLPDTLTGSFYLSFILFQGVTELPNRPNRETIITYVNCWFPDEYRAYFGYPGGTEYYFERWDSDIYREQYTFIDCHVNVSSQVVFFGKGSAVVSAMVVSARGIPSSWPACQDRMRWYEHFSTTNTTLTLPNKSINVTLAVPANCYYGPGLAVYRDSCKMLSLTSVWINKTFTVAIPTNGNYSIYFYATFRGAFYQTRRDIGLVVPVGATDPPRMLSSPPDISYPLTQTSTNRSIPWTCIHDHPQSITITLNGNIVTNNGTRSVAFSPSFTPNNAYNGIVTFQFSQLPHEGVYVATIIVNGTDGSMMTSTVLITVLPDGSTPFDSSAGVTLDDAGYYASNVIQQPITIAGPLNTTGPVSISVGTWTAPPFPGPTTNGTYFGIYADNQANINFPITIIVPLPPSYVFGDNLKLLTWNGTTWIDSGFLTDPIGPQFTTAKIILGHLSIYALLIYDPYSFARYDLATLMAMVNATNNISWSKPCEKKIMLDKIGVVQKLFNDGYYELAYAKLLHDVKPKLAGLKTDENGTPWDNGTFKHPWIVDPALRSTLRVVIDAALASIKACQIRTIHDALGSLGNDLVMLDHLIDEQLSGCKKERCDRLIDNATTLYSAMLAKFQQNETISCIDIVRFHSIIARIDAIARDAVIRQECNAIIGLLGKITRAEFHGFIRKLWCGFHHRARDHHCCESAVTTNHRHHEASRENKHVMWSSRVLYINDSTPVSCNKDNQDMSQCDRMHSITGGNTTACTGANMTNDQAHHHAINYYHDFRDHSYNDHAW